MEDKDFKHRGSEADRGMRLLRYKTLISTRDRKFKIELQFSVSDIDLNNLYLKTPRG